MKDMNKHKIIVVCVIFLFAGLSVSPVIANELAEREIQDETIDIEYGLINSDGSIITEKTTLSKQEFADLESSLSEFMEKIQSVNDYNEFRNAVKLFCFQFKCFISLKIFTHLCCDAIPRSRVLVASYGWGYELNLFKDSAVNVYKPLNFWHYSPQSDIGIPSKTFALRSMPFDTKILSGRQVGVMTGFLGIYIYIAQSVPQKSFTFFMGSARIVLGMDFPSFPYLNLGDRLSL